MKELIERVRELENRLDYFQLLYADVDPIAYISNTMSIMDELMVLNKQLFFYQSNMLN